MHICIHTLPDSITGTPSCTPGNSEGVAVIYLWSFGRVWTRSHVFQFVFQRLATPVINHSFKYKWQQLPALFKEKKKSQAEWTQAIQTSSLRVSNIWNRSQASHNWCVSPQHGMAGTGTAYPYNDRILQKVGLTGLRKQIISWNSISGHKDKHIRVTCFQATKLVK